MEDKFITETDDIETFVFSEDRSENASSPIVKYEEADIQFPSGRFTSTYDFYIEQKKKFPKTARKKRSKGKKHKKKFPKTAREKRSKGKKHKKKFPKTAREKRSKGKKHKKKGDSKDHFLPCIPQRDVIGLFEQQRFLEESIIREGHDVPSSLIFNPRRESAFLIGKTLSGEFVGKHQDDDGHIAIFGGSGSGKTSSIAIPTTTTWRGSIFSFDFKGDLIKWAKRRNPKILNILRGQKNHCWYDPFYFLHQDSEANLVENARELAHAIIPMPHNVSDPFWVESARNVLTGAIVYYYHCKVGFIDAMINIKTTKMSDLLKKIGLNEEAAVCVNPDLDSNPKTLAGVSMELHNHISVFATDKLIQDVLSPSEDTPKDIIRWEDLEAGDILIRLDQSKLEQWRSVMRIMLVQLIRTLERRPEKNEPEGAKVKPTLLMLDEFPQYGKIDVITSALKILRSKNVTASIFCQSLADLDETYGKDTRRALLDNCPYKAILSASDAETQRYFSDLVGTVKVPAKGLSANFDEFGQPYGYSASINESREPIIQPHEFASLSDIVLLHPGPGRFCRVEKEMYFRKEPSPKVIERN